MGFIFRSVKATSEMRPWVLCRNVKVMFAGLALLVTVMIVVLQDRIGRGAISTLRHAFFEPDYSSNNRHQQARLDEASHEIDQVKLHASHNHDKQVGFVLHESPLGAPEFIGRNLKNDAWGFDRMGNPETFLNVPVDQSDSLYDRGSGENRVAIGCALTTRQQENLNRENIAAELPFFKGLLVSFCTTATRGFDYHFYVAHDHSDPFFRIPGAHDLFVEVFNDRVMRRCPRRVNATLHLVECEHTGIWLFF